MTLYIRNRDNKTIVDIELFATDGFVELHSVVVVSTYSELLLSRPNEQEEIIRDFTRISELRGWLWETYFGGRQNVSNELNAVRMLVRERLQEVARKYGLCYVED